MHSRGTSGKRFKANGTSSSIEIKNIEPIEIAKL
jgi:hypothetical protein